MASSQTVGDYTVSYDDTGLNADSKKTADELAKNTATLINDENITMQDYTELQRELDELDKYSHGYDVGGYVAILSQVFYQISIVMQDIGICMSDVWNIDSNISTLNTDAQNDANEMFNGAYEDIDPATGQPITTNPSYTNTEGDAAAQDLVAITNLFGYTDASGAQHGTTFTVTNDRGTVLDTGHGLLDFLSVNHSSGAGNTGKFKMPMSLETADSISGYYSTVVDTYGTTWGDTNSSDGSSMWLTSEHWVQSSIAPTQDSEKNTNGTTNYNPATAAQQPDEINTAFDGSTNSLSVASQQAATELENLNNQLTAYEKEWSTMNDDYAQSQNYSVQHQLN